jgi:Uma2 family endonuclease
VDLAIEVVSEGRAARDRDYRTKRREYARAGIPEYWIVDPEKECIVVLKLVKKRYQVHGVFGRGQLVTSASLQGFSVAIDAVFAAARD